MANINVKIMGTDPFNKLVLVACATEGSVKPLEEQPLSAYPFDFGGATNVDEFLANIQDSCREKAFAQDQVSSAEYTADNWVGATSTFTPVPVDTSEFTFQARKDAIYATYPAANMDAVNALCNRKWNQMQLAPLRRDVDATIVGVYVNGYGGMNAADAAIALRSIKEATNECVALGIPMCGGTTPVDGMSRERFESFLTGISQYNKFINTVKQSYVYQDWNIVFARNRKATLIKSECQKVIAGGLNFDEHVWDSDAASRANITNYLVANPTLTTTEWRTKGNELVRVDLALLSKALSDFVTATYQESWARKAALAALPPETTEAEVDAI
jgi:hypothetical protein